MIVYNHNQLPHPTLYCTTSPPHHGRREDNCLATALAIAKLTRLTTECQTTSSCVQEAKLSTPWRRPTRARASGCKPPSVSKENAWKSTERGCAARTSRYDTPLRVTAFVNDPPGTKASRCDTASGEDPTTSTKRSRPSSQSRSTMSGRLPLCSRDFHWEVRLPFHPNTQFPSNTEEKIAHHVMPMRSSNRSAIPTLNSMVPPTIHRLRATRAHSPLRIQRNQ
jgi:hypothetical protein